MAGLIFWPRARREMNMKTHQQRLADLHSKFPAINAAIARINENGSVPSNDEVRISVERVDRDMLCNTAMLCSGRGSSLCDSSLPGLLGWQHEVFFAVNAQHEIIGQIGAMKPVEDERDYRQVKHLLLDHRQQVAYLVRVVVTGWCKRINDWIGKDSPLGELVQRTLEVTVYREPDQGFSDLLAETWTDDNLRLHFRSFGLPMNPDVQYFLKRLLPMIRQFEERTFFNGLHSSLPLNTLREEGQLADVCYNVTTWEDGNKVDLHLHRGDVFVWFFYSGVKGSLYHNGGHLAINGIDATLQEVRSLLDDVNIAWQRKLIGEDTIAELQQLWQEAVVQVSTVYGLRLADDSIDLQREVPGLKILARDGDQYLVEVPTESNDAFAALEARGVIPSISRNECVALQRTVDEAKERSRRALGNM
jgi:hypothetical protein